MGRSNPTFRNRLDGIERGWQAYRRPLRRPDQQRFDRLFETARGHADAAGQLNHAEPLFPILVSMLLAQQRRLEGLEARIDTLEAALGHRSATDPDRTRIHLTTRRDHSGDGSER